MDQSSGPVSGRRAPDSGPVLTLNAVSRSFGDTIALAPLSLRLDAGAICAVVGPNGSGKSTLLRLAASLLAPSTGTREAEGLALYLSAGSGMRDAQTLAQAVAFAARLAGQPARVEQLLQLVGLRGFGQRMVRTLSAGQRARGTLAVALAASPAVVCLDEPTAHLDADGAATAAAVLDELTARGTAALVATHDPSWLRYDVRLALERGHLMAAT